MAEQIKRYQHIGPLLEHSEAIFRLYPMSTVYVRADDHDAALAAKDARIAELERASGTIVMTRMLPDLAEAHRIASWIASAECHLDPSKHYRVDFRIIGEPVGQQPATPSEDGRMIDTSAWEACNPGCDPEFNGEKSRHCCCEAAKAAMSAQQQSPATSKDAWDVVGYLYRTPSGPYVSLVDFQGHPRDDLMTVAQHSRIVAAKDAKLIALDKQCRDDVARALDLTPHGDGYAWSSLLAEIKTAVKIAQPARQVGGDELRIVFDGPPGPECGRFVEVENASGMSVNAGEWRQRPDELWELVINCAALAPAAVVMPERKEYPTRATYPDARDFAAVCLEVDVWNTLLDKVARLNRRAIPVGLLERCLEQMESDWLQIDGEWGPTKGGLEGAVANGDAEEIRELRALLGKDDPWTRNR